MAAFLAQKGMQFIDTLMMGWLGPEALAAGGLGTTVFMTLLIFARGIFSAVGILIVHARGASQENEITHILQQAFYLAILISPPLMILSWRVPLFLTLIGQNPEVVKNTQLLLNGLTWGIPPFLFFYILREYISSFALAHAIMFVSLFSIPLTFVLNYLLIYGKLGFPKLGIAGIGYASAAVIWFIFACLLFYCTHKSILKKYLWVRLQKFDWDKCLKLFYLGAPNGIILMLDTGMFFAAALMVGYFGIPALASYQIAMQSVSIAYNLPSAVSVVTSLEVGRAAAARQIDKVKHIAFLALSTGFTISLFFSIIFIFFPEIILKIFLINKEKFSDSTYYLAKSSLIIASFLLSFDALQVIINGALRGLKDTFVPMIFTLFCYLVLGTGGAYLMGFKTTFAAIGVWYGLTFAIASLTIILGFRFWKLLNNPTHWRI